MIAEATEISTQVTIQPVSYSAILDSPNSVDLLRTYAEHCLVPDPEPQRPLYEAMERIGTFQAFAAYFSGQNDDSAIPEDCDLEARVSTPVSRLIGFVGVIRAIVPHDGHLIAATESLFVDPSYRWTGAFFLLIAAAEKFATDSGCRCLLASARINSPLDFILSDRDGYEKTHNQHTRWLNGYKGGRA